MVFGPAKDPAEFVCAFGLEKICKKLQVGGQNGGIFIPAGISNCRSSFGNGPLLAVRRGGFLRLQGLVTCSLDYHSKLSRFLEPFQPFPFPRIIMHSLKATRIGKHPLILGTLVVLACLLAGVRANAKEDDLINAAEKGDLPRVKELITNGAAVNAKTKYGMTALMMASLNGRLEVVPALLAKGAVVNAKTMYA